MIPVITRIFGKGFKGMIFDIPIKQHNLILGLNGKGKSAITQALTLTRLGYIPGYAKKPAELIKDFSSGEPFSVGFETLEDNVKNKYQRGFMITGKGVGKEMLKINEITANKSDFLIAMSKLPAIMDLSTFMKLSDQKQIDYLFKIYPPAENLQSLDAEVETLKDAKNALEQKVKTTFDVVQRLTTSKLKISGDEIKTGLPPESFIATKLVSSPLNNAVSAPAPPKSPATKTV